jgi:hypothetical protein
MTAVRTANFQPRSHIATGGSFVAVPDAFPNLDDSIRMALKLETWA